MWTTCQGFKVAGAWEFIGRPYQKWTERDRELIQGYQNLERAAMNLDQELSRLRWEAEKLRAENEFMLRFVSKHMQEIPDA